MQAQAVADHIVDWLESYRRKTDLNGFVVGVSGGVDSGLTSKLCCLTGVPTFVVDLPLHQPTDQKRLAEVQIGHLVSTHDNAKALEVDLTSSFEALKGVLPSKTQEHELALANTRARLRMTTLYAIAQSNECLVVGTGNKVEDFGIGFFTKYGDGGVDISPIADLSKTQVRELAEHLGIPHEIAHAVATDGLWPDKRNDEEQIGATYKELEEAMEFKGDPESLKGRQRVVWEIFDRFHRINQHKMEPIPVCEVPKKLLH